VRFSPYVVLALLSTFCLSVLTTPASARAQETVPSRSRDAGGQVRTGRASAPSEAIATVERFRNALARGDSSTALALLASDAIILESGDVETREEYRRHHLSADIEFARAIPSISSQPRAVVEGDVAWVTSTSVTQGRFKDRDINSAGAELIVLSRRGKASPWQIRAIHWSSHRRAP
jgi:ketosteroid isomerase-like protein